MRMVIEALEKAESGVRQAKKHTLIMGEQFGKRMKDGAERNILPSNGFWEDLRVACVGLSHEQCVAEFSDQLTIVITHLIEMRQGLEVLGEE